ncbi:MAG: 50S ribosomal protein L29 [Phycisphaeraceae bacterium]|nr:MAG: 50S ribosomal protein L29 [Phycisphaeraceae bacterium]
MKGKEVNTMRPDELANELKRLRTALFDLRSKSVTEKVEDTSQFKKIRRDIARVMTRQRSMQAQA